MKPLFDNAFPRMQDVYKKNAAATLRDFVDVNKIVQINRRGIFTYDVLIQPDVLKILRTLDPSCELNSRVDMTRKDALRVAGEIRAEIEKRLPSFSRVEQYKELQPITTRIYWGTYSLLKLNKLAGINSSEPYYFAVRRSVT